MSVALLLGREGSRGREILFRRRCHIQRQNHAPSRGQAAPTGEKLDAVLVVVIEVLLVQAVSCSPLTPTLLHHTPLLLPGCALGTAVPVLVKQTRTQDAGFRT